MCFSLNKNESFTIAPVRYRGKTRALRECEYDLGAGVSLGECPRWLKEDQNLLNLLDFARREFLDSAKLALIIRAGEEETVPKGEQERLQAEAIQLANLSLWLAGPSQASFEFIACYACHDGGTRMWNSVSTMNRLWPRAEYVAGRLTQDDLEMAKVFNLALHEIGKKTPVWRGIELLWRALTDESWDLRYLLIWMSLESLFGTDSEISFRISQRIAFFTADTIDQARRHFETARRGYDIRSKLAHGALPTRQQRKTDLDRLLVDCEELTRAALSRILGRPAMRKAFCSTSARDQLLNELVFSFGGR